MPPPPVYTRPPFPLPVAPLPVPLPVHSSHRNCRCLPCHPSRRHRVGPGLHPAYHPPGGTTGGRAAAAAAGPGARCVGSWRICRIRVGKKRARQEESLRNCALNRTCGRPACGRTIALGWCCATHSHAGSRTLRTIRYVPIAPAPLRPPSRFLLAEPSVRPLLSLLSRPAGVLLHAHNPLQRGGPDAGTAQPRLHVVACGVEGLNWF